VVEREKINFVLDSRGKDSREIDIVIVFHKKEENWSFFVCF